MTYSGRMATEAMRAIRWAASRSHRRRGRPVCAECGETIEKPEVEEFMYQGLSFHRKCLGYRRGAKK